MTREEAIIHIRTLKTVIKDIEKYNGKAIDKSLSMAIKSLEAWEKVREIFKAKSTSEDWEYIHDLQIWEDALEIIDKNLTEVEK